MSTASRHFNVYMFDDLGKPLQVKGIGFDLFNTKNGKWIDGRLSDDFTQPPPTPSTNEWGVTLSYSPISDPLEVLVSDKKYDYPGNAIRSFNGQVSGRLDIDLIKIPPGSGGQGYQPDPSAAALAAWVRTSNVWTPSEKMGAWNLITNYIALILPWLPLDPEPERVRVGANWREALQLIDLAPEILEQGGQAGQPAFA